MQTIINIIVFILILGSIIIIHEFGHFLAAKHFGVYCSQFSIGFGPKIYSKQGEETEFELRALPIGGFVSMAGEADQEEVEEMKDLPIERTLKGKKTYQKVIIFSAGVIMNFILAIVVLFASNVIGGEVVLEQATVGSVSEGSAAEIYGLQEDDEIEELYVVESDKTIAITTYESFSEALTKDNLGVSDDDIDIVLTVLRDGEEEAIDMIISFNEETDKYYFGISFKTRSMTMIECVTYTIEDFGEMSTAIIEALAGLIVNFASTVTQLSGPAGIYQVTAEVTSTGSIAYILRLLGLLSVNIGIFNLMPIPGLDGAQILFALVERVIGREIPINLKLVLQMVGLGLVLLLMVFVTYQDILRIIG